MKAHSTFSTLAEGMAINLIRALDPVANVKGEERVDLYHEGELTKIRLWETLQV